MYIVRIDHTQIKTTCLYQIQKCIRNFNTQDILLYTKTQPISIMHPSPHQQIALSLQAPNYYMPICRICLEEQHPSNQHPHPSHAQTQPQPSPPLLKPCKCRGTHSYIHQHCLIKWIVNTTWRRLKDRNGTYILCQLCQAPIYFDIGNESWCSWLHNKPCSAIFYLLWIIILILSFCAIVFLAVFATLTKEYEVLRFLGLPLGIFVFGGFMFYHCGQGFRDYQTNIVTIKNKYKVTQQENKDKQTIKSSSSDLKSIDFYQADL